MINQHPTDEELQLFVTEQQNSYPRISSHIETCEICREQVIIYRSLICDIEDQASPVADFDINALVLARIRPAGAKYKKDGAISVMAIFLVACVVIIPLYIFRFNFLTMVNATSVVVLYASVVSCVMVVVYKTVQLFRKYQRQIKTLNFSQ